MESRKRSKVAGKIAVITGASSGIGEVTALEFGRAGATVVLAARRAERLEAVAASITAAGGSALSVRTDLTDGSQIANLVQTTLRRFGRIDVLANIAGWGHYDWFEELTAERLRQHFEVNVIGLAELTRQVLPAMKSQRSGIILNMSSYASRIAIPPLTVYASTKYAVEGLSDALRRELRPWGIRVIRVHPSAVTGTEFNHKAAQEGGIRYRSFSIGRVPRERVARALLRVVERPRSALFIGRIYDFAMVANWVFPWLIDWISSTWVRSMRKKELAP